MRLFVSTDQRELTDLLETYVSRSQIEINSVHESVGMLYLPKLGFCPGASISSNALALDDARLVNQVAAQLTKEGLFVAQMGQVDLVHLHKPANMTYRDLLLREALSRPSTSSQYVYDESLWLQRKTRGASLCFAYSNCPDKINPNFKF